MAKQKKTAEKTSKPSKKTAAKQKDLKQKDVKEITVSPEVVPADAPTKTQLTETNLVALAAAASKPAEVSVTFTAGIGQITALLFRNGVLINMQSISTSGSIHFAEVQSGDAISVNGVCTGQATVSINVPTDPETPSSFSAQNIHIGYDIV